MQEVATVLSPAQYDFYIRAKPESDHALGSHCPQTKFSWIWEDTLHECPLDMSPWLSELLPVGTNEMVDYLSRAPNGDDTPSLIQQRRNSLKQVEEQYHKSVGEGSVLGFLTAANASVPVIDQNFCEQM